MQVIVHADRQTEQWRPGVETRMQVSALNGATQLCIFEQWIAPGTGAPPHSHAVEEVLTVMAGEAEISVGESRAIVRGGQSVVVPARSSHGFVNVGSGLLHVQAVLASPIFEATFDGSAGPVRRWLPFDSEPD